MAQVIVPGIPKIVEVTVLNGQLTGTAFHYMGTKPRCGKPNPNVADGAASGAFATADDSIITVSCDVPVSQDIVFNVPVIV